MRPRAFTLIEVVVALTLVVMMMALVGPALLRRVAPITFDSAVAQAESALRTVREDARRRGEVLFVYAEPEDPSLPGSPMTLLAHTRMLDAVDATILTPPGGAGQTPTGDTAARGNEDSGRTLIALPSRIRLSRERPEDMGSDLDSAAGEPGWPGDRGEASSGAELLADGPPPEQFLLAIFLPDGSVVAPGEAWLSQADPAGLPRLARLRVDTAVGRVRFEHVDASAVDPDALAEPEDELALPPSPSSRVPTGGPPRGPTP